MRKIKIVADSSANLMTLDHVAFDAAPLKIITPEREFVDNRELKPDPWEHVGDDTLEGAYFRLLQGKLASASDAEADIIQLAADLSRVILDGKEVVL